MAATPQRDKPLRIPLSFDQALSGLLAVDPKKLPKTARPGAKKPKNRPKHNRNNRAKG